MTPYPLGKQEWRFLTDYKNFRKSTEVQGQANVIWPKMNEYIDNSSLLPKKYLSSNKHIWCGQDRIFASAPVGYPIIRPCGWAPDFLAFQNSVQLCEDGRGLKRAGTGCELEKGLQSSPRLFTVGTVLNFLGWIIVDDGKIAIKFGPIIERHSGRTERGKWGSCVDD